MRTFRILQPIGVVLVVYLIFTFFLLRYYQGDISCLIHAGVTFTNASETPKELCLKDSGDGYDGQFNYRFALNPFSNQPVLYGISVDQPAYRYQRIFYPFLTWVLTLGNRRLVPIVFVLINLLSACAITALAAVYSLGQGRNSYWSLAIGLYPGFLLSYALDLGHTLEVLLLFSALFLTRRKDFWAAVLLTCAVLTRETAVILAAAVCAVALFQRWECWYVYLLPIGVFAAWQVFVFLFWRGVPILVQGESLVLPLTGFVSALASCWQRGDIFGIFMLAAVLCLGTAVLFAVWRSPVPAFVKLAWLIYSAMVVMLSFTVWAKFNGYLRGLSEWYFFGYLILLPVMGRAQVLFMARESAQAGSSRVSRPYRADHSRACCSRVRR
jgi:hypothetical protein